MIKTNKARVLRLAIDASFFRSALWLIEEKQMVAPLPHKVLYSDRSTAAADQQKFFNSPVCKKLIMNEHRLIETWLIPAELETF